MTDAAFNPTASSPAAAAPRDIGIKRRRAAEKRFRIYGASAIIIGLAFLVLLLVSIVSKGYTAFFQTMITLPIEFSEKVIDPSNKRATDPKVLITANYPNLARDAVAKAAGIDPKDRPGIAKLKGFVSDGIRAQLRDMVIANPEIIGQTIPVTFLASANIDSAYKGQIDLTVAESNRKISDAQIEIMNKLSEAGALRQHFNPDFFTNGASSRPEASGLGVAIIGSIYTMLIVLALALPIGVCASGRYFSSA